jgi:hypothetical protein
VKRRRRLAVVALLLSTGCSTATGPPRSEAESSPDLTLAFTQLLPDEGTERGLLRVRNDASEAVDITGIGLDWPGYGKAFRQDKDVTIGPGRTMDLKLTLPAPVCADTDQPVRAVIESAGRPRVQELSSAGETFLRYLWRKQCSKRYVEDRLDIAYGDTWRQRGHGRDASVLGSLQLSRIDGDEPVRLVSVQGSVLYGLELPGRRRLQPGATAVEVPLAVLPGDRCDEHARGQATAPFVFRLQLRIGAAEPMKVLIPPPPAGQAAATAMLDRSCRQRR